MRRPRPSRVGRPSAARTSEGQRSQSKSRALVCSQDALSSSLRWPRRDLLRNSGGFWAASRGVSRSATGRRARRRATGPPAGGRFRRRLPALRGGPADLRRCELHRAVGAHAGVGLQREFLVAAVVHADVAAVDVDVEAVPAHRPHERDGDGLAIEADMDVRQTQLLVGLGDLARHAAHVEQVDAALQERERTAAASASAADGTAGSSAGGSPGRAPPAAATAAAASAAAICPVLWSSAPPGASPRR